LVIDPDGAYDPRLVNDRLLLGLKGTMSEYELSLLRQRGIAARDSKARRGEYRFMLRPPADLVPVGSVVHSIGRRIAKSLETAPRLC